MGVGSGTILHVITTINRGGAENHLFSLVSGQIARGQKVCVAYLKGNGYWTRQFENLGVRVLALGLKRYGELRPLLRLRKFVSETAPAVVHAHLPPAEVYARLALVGAPGRPKFVISKHNAMQFVRAPGWRLLGRAIGRRADKVIGISDAVRAYVTTQYRLAPTRVESIHYGIDTTPYDSLGCDWEEVRRQYGCPGDGWIIGTVARLVPEKNLRMLLEGYSLYRDDASRPSRLVIAGAGPLDAELRAYAASRGLSDNVVWLGFREDIPTIMRSFDLFALTSITEGFGLVLLEAMAAGRPVVATRVNAIPEVVAQDQTGLLVPSGDAQALARALVRLEDDTLRMRLGTAGAWRAKNDFAIDRMVERTLKLYVDVMDGSNTVLSAS